MTDGWKSELTKDVEDTVRGDGGWTGKRLSALVPLRISCGGSPEVSVRFGEKRSSFTVEAILAALGWDSMTQSWSVRSRCIIQYWHPGACWVYYYQNNHSRPIDYFVFSFRLFHFFRVWRQLFTTKTIGRRQCNHGVNALSLVHIATGSDSTIFVHP